MKKSKKKDKTNNKITFWIKKGIPWFILFLLLIAQIYSRFINLEKKNNFGYDQMENAKVIKSIINEHHIPLKGMVAKQNAGFNIGPLYYYLLTPFYMVFKNEVIASGAFAGTISLFTFFTFFFFIKKLFSFRIALIVLTLHTFSVLAVENDRSQWPVNFIAPISLIIFFALYKIMTGNPKYLLLLAVACGFSLHVHFTSVFYFIIILLSLYYFPRTKKSIKYYVSSFFIFLLFLLPLIIANVEDKGGQVTNLQRYLQTYNHGFHLQRLSQVAADAFIEIELFLNFSVFKPLKFILIPLFILVHYFKNKTLQKWRLSFLTILWFIVPWIAFSTYKGEISNYYFFMTRPIALFLIAYFIDLLLKIKFIPAKLASISFVVCYILYNNREIYLRYIKL